ncbi:Hypothetical predicted protein [Paramuricea clavata]|uniref:Uncharacterized protein n=1 Tax=Paramuricea clavata TaxID=317549 RepID=A0A6S7GWB6_PARCT|nr:Hypothetical predicted protein [Paramuricea clavata]
MGCQVGRERDEDISKGAAIGGFQNESGPCKVGHKKFPIAMSTHQNEHGLFTRNHKKQVLLPASPVPTILSLAHDETGHQGADKMLARIETHYWWPNSMLLLLPRDTEMHQFINDQEKRNHLH